MPLNGQQLQAVFPRRLSRNKGELKLATTAAAHLTSTRRVSPSFPAPSLARRLLTR